MCVGVCLCVRVFEGVCEGVCLSEHVCLCKGTCVSMCIHDDFKIV